MARLFLFVLLLLAASNVCAQEVATVECAARQTHEQLQAALWVRTSVEHDVACVQAYKLAAMRVEEALADKSWTAATEQTGNFHELPPAVVLDVDESVLDNSTFQVRLIQQNIDFSAKLWDQWVAEEAAGAVPGAKEFIDFLVERNVEVLFVTNRDASGETATVRNLAAVLGRTVTHEQVLCKKEQKDWTSAKTARRALLAKSYRLLLLVGDDFNDFVSFGEIAPEERVAKGREYRHRWGTRWIQLPNPLYGNWEKSVFGYNYGLTDEQKLQVKYRAIQGGADSQSQRGHTPE